VLRELRAFFDGLGSADEVAGGVPGGVDSSRLAGILLWCGVTGRTADDAMGRAGRYVYVVKTS
jgi:hypothetical protein